LILISLRLATTYVDCIHSSINLLLHKLSSISNLFPRDYWADNCWILRTLY